MHIIFGDSVNLIPDSYTVLKLDTIRYAPTQQLIPTWCVVEKIPLAEFAQAEANRKIHNDLMEQYYQRNWDFCLRAISSLQGAWDKELDSFYEDLKRRVEDLVQNPPDETWDGLLIKTSDQDQEAK